MSDESISLANKRYFCQWIYQSIDYFNFFQQKLIKYTHDDTYYNIHSLKVIMLRLCLHTKNHRTIKRIKYDPKNHDYYYFKSGINDSSPSKPTIEKSYDSILDILQKDGMTLNLIKNPTPGMCGLAVKQNCYALQYVHIKDQTKAMCIRAVRQNGLVLQYVKNQTDLICAIAVLQNGFALQFVENQTELLCILAVQQTGYALQFVENQTDLICEIAVKQTRHAMRFVNKKTDILNLNKIIATHRYGDIPKIINIE